MSTTDQPRTIVITGASSGIGAVAARELAAAGNRVAVVGRNPDRTKKVADEIGASAHLADFDVLDDVRRLGDELLDAYPRIDVLANNAGGLVSERTTTVDGHERTFQSNVLAPFLLTELLRERIVETAAQHGNGRIVFTASVANRFGSARVDDLEFASRRWAGGWRAYGAAKLETILVAKELAERLLPTKVDVFSFHPGFVATEFGSTSTAMRVMQTITRGQYGISAAAGAVPLIRLASREPVPAATGTYFDGLKPNGSVARQVKDAGLGRDLWSAYERMLGIRTA